MKRFYLILALFVSLFMFKADVLASTLNVTTEDIANQNNLAHEYNPTLHYREANDLEKKIAEIEDNSVINLQPGDYIDTLLELNSKVTVNFEPGIYKNLFVRVKNEVVFNINGNVTFEGSTDIYNYGAIWISGNEDDTISGSLTIKGDTLTIKKYSMGIVGQRFDAGSKLYDGKLNIENKKLTITDLHKAGMTWNSSWMQPVDTLSTWQHGVAIFFTGTKDSLPEINIKNGAQVFLLGNGDASNTGNTTTTGIYVSSAGRVNITENSKLVIDGVSGNAFHTQADTGLSNSNFKVTVVDSILGIRNAGGLGFNNLNTGLKENQYVLFDNAKVIVTAGKSAGVQYGTFDIINGSEVIMGSIPEGYEDLYKNIFDVNLVENENFGNDRDGFYIHNLLLKDSTLITNGNTCAGLDITEGEAIIENSYVESSYNGMASRYSGWKPSRKMGIFFNGGATIRDSKVITNDNGKSLSDVENSVIVNMSGIVAQKEVKFYNSFIRSTDPFAWDLYNTSSASGVIIIDENTVSIAEGSYMFAPSTQVDKDEVGNNDIADDYNTDGVTGSVIVDSGSLQASSEVTVDNYNKPYDDINTRVSIVNSEGDKLYRFDLHDAVNTEVGVNSSQSGSIIKYFTYYNKINGQKHLYTFRFNLLGEDLIDGTYGNAYVWAPYSLITFDATQGKIVTTNSTAEKLTDRLAMDITIYGNSLNLAEKVMPTAEREGYKFLGWYVYTNSGNEVMVDTTEDLANRATSDGKYFESLYSVLNTKFNQDTKITSIFGNDETAMESITVYAKWAKESTVTISYITDEGETLHEDIVINGLIGEEYETEEKVFEGYELVEVKGDKTGIFAENDTHVTYIYQYVLGEGGDEVEDGTDKPNIPEIPQTGTTENMGLITTIASSLIIAFIAIKKKVLL